MTATFNVGNREVGGDAPTFIIAEVGANHDGDPAAARKLVDVAAEAGADAVKFQTYTAAELLSDPERIIEWGEPGQEIKEPVGVMFDRIALKREDHKALFEYAESLGLIPFSTPFSPDGARFLDGIGAPVFKVASSDVCYVELLDACAKTGKPVILSTGKSTLSEVDESVNQLIDAATGGVAVLHCVAQYPAPVEDLNLRAIEALIHLYPHCVIGYSDHALGITACLGAVALGAKVIEKHITYDKKDVGPDHWMSADPSELTSLVREVRILEAALNHTEKRVMPSEIGERQRSTRNLVVNRPMKAGSVITAADLSVKRSPKGINPREEANVIGMELRVDLPAGSSLQWDHFRPEQ